MKKIKISLLTILSMAPLVAHVYTPMAIAARDINLPPDDVDFGKYYNLYTQSKAYSDGLRSTANQSLAEARQTDQSISYKTDQLSQQEQSIIDNQDAIRRLTDDIPALEAQNRQLSQEIQNHNLDIQANSQVIGDLNRRAYDLQNEWKREDHVRSEIERDLKDVTQRLHRMREQLDQLRDDIKQKERKAEATQKELEDKRAALKQKQDLQASLQAELPEKNAKLQEAKGAVAPAEQALNQATARYNSEKQNNDGLKTLLAQAQASQQTAQTQFDAANAVVVEVQGRLNKVEKLIAQTAAKLKDAQAALQNKKADLDKTKQKVIKLAQEKTALEAALPALEKAAKDALDAQAVLQNSMAELDREMDAIKAEMNELQKPPRTPEKGERLAVLMPQMQEKKQKKEALAQQLTVAKANAQAATARVTSTKQDIENKAKEFLAANQQLPNLEKEVATLTTEKDAAKAAADAALAAKAPVDAELSTAKAKLEPVQAQLNAANTSVKNSKDALAVSSGLLTQVENQKKAAEQVLNSAKDKVAQLQKRIDAINAQIPALNPEMDQLKKEIEQKQHQLAQQNQELSDLDKRLAEARRHKEGMEFRKEKIEKDLTEQDRRLADLNRSIRSLRDDADRLTTENNRLDRLATAKTKQISINEGTAKSNRVEIIARNRSIEQLSASNAQLRIDIPRLKDLSPRQWAQYRADDAKAQSAEQVTAQKLSKYQEIRANYNTQLLAAQEKGKDQGLENGGRDGEAQAIVDGSAVGQEEGSLDGKREGLQFGYDLGLKEGSRDGKTEGYKAGRASTKDYNSGYEEGLRLGEDEAKLYAEQVSRPQGRADRKKELLSRIPEKTLELDNVKDAQSSSFQTLGASALKERSEAYSVLAAEQIVQNNALTLRAGDITGGTMMGMEASVASSTKVNAHMAQVMFSSGQGVNSTLALVNVDLKKANCEFGFVDFNKACQDSYKSAYSEKYEEVYGPAKIEAKDKAYAKAKDLAFKANENVRHKEGYDKNYGIAYAKWNATAIGEVQAEGKAEGRKVGYNRVVESLKATEYNNGLAMESEYFAQNAVIRLLDAEIYRVNKDRSDSNFMAGDTLGLKLKLANFGAKNSTKGQVKIKWEPVTNNVATEDSVTQLISIPSQTSASVSSIAFAKIAMTTGDEPVRLKITAWLPDGVVQTKEIQINTKLLIFPTVTKEYDARPYMYRFVQNPGKNGGTTKKIRIIDVAVKMKNASPYNANKVFRATLSLPNQSGLELVKAEAGSSKFILAGESETLVLQYSVTDKKLAGKPLSLSLKYYFGEVLTGSEVIEVVPRN